MLKIFLAPIILIAFFLLLLIQLAFDVDKPIYMYFIKKRFKRWNFSIISVTKAPHREDTNEYPYFMIKGGGNAISYIRKNIAFEDVGKNQGNCLVTIKKFMFFIIDIDYTFI